MELLTFDVNIFNFSRQCQIALQRECVGMPHTFWELKYCQLHSQQMYFPVFCLLFPIVHGGFFSYNFTFSILKNIKIIIIFVFACHVHFGALNAKCFPESWPVEYLVSCCLGEG